MIDDVKVVRAMYLIITSETPVPGGIVQPGTEAALSIPILGQMGVIYRPDISSETFATPEQIEALFAALEVTLNYAVELEDIWIPEDWLQHRPTISRGELYRLTFDLFEACYRYREGIMTQIGSLTDLNPEPQEIQFSAEETQAFRDWNQQQIQNAKDIYPKNTDLALKWEDAKTYS
jgi:hypothetical protein